MKVLVAYESRGGKTKEAAAAIADAAKAAGNDVNTKPLAETSSADLSAADAVFIGTWVEGFILFGVGPAKAAIKGIKGLAFGSKPVASFCTFGFNPRSALAILRGLLEGRGAKVVGEKAFNRREPGAGAADFVKEVLAKV